MSYYNIYVVFCAHTLCVADFGNGICDVSIRSIEKGRQGVGQDIGQGIGEGSVGQGHDIGKSFGQGLEFHYMFYSITIVSNNNDRNIRLTS